MTLKRVLQKFLDHEGWKDEIKHNDSDDVDFIATVYEIDGQGHRLILIVDEKRKWLKTLLFSPIKVPRARAKEAAFVLNYLNGLMSTGNLQLSQEGEVYYRWTIDVEGATAAPQQFGALISSAACGFDAPVCQAIGAAAFSKQSAEDIIKEYEEAAKKAIEQEKEEAEADEPDDVPSAL